MFCVSKGMYNSQSFDWYSKSVPASFGLDLKRCGLTTITLILELNRTPRVPYISYC